MPQPNIPTATPVHTGHAGWNVPTAIPVDDAGNSLIPELCNRPPTHNESILIAGDTISMASSNVASFWWVWGHGTVYEPKIFVEFLSGALYVYEGPDASLTLATDFVQTASPGRFIWNVMRRLWPVPTARGSGPGTYRQLKPAAPGRRRRRPQVVRLYP